MKILSIHSDFVEFAPVSKAIPSAEEAEKGLTKIKDCLVIFSSIEKSDEKNWQEIARKAVSEIEDIAKQVKENRIVLYPFVHLSSTPSSPDVALKVLKEAEKLLKEGKYEVYRAPFGWYKAFDIKCKGHPLSELSREIKLVDSKKEQRQKEAGKKEFKILALDGKLVDPNDYKYKPNEKNFKIMVEKEALGKEAKGSGSEPRYIKFAKKFQMDWEPMSDSGHMRYGPEGTLILDLAGDYSLSIVKSLGLPIYHVKGTNMFNMKEKAVGEHAELFGDRLYQLDVEGSQYVMRYAACFQQFAMIKDWVISYKNMPFGAFEVADSYRLEQSGELVLLFRVRKFQMPDCHVFCRDMEEAKKWFSEINDKIFDEAHKIEQDYEMLINLTSHEFFEENKDFFIGLLKSKKKPALLCFYPPGKDYYWKVNIEHNIIDALDRVREIGTVQIDVGNAQRFGISYTDEKGQKQHPIILHTAVIGGLERYLYSIFDRAVKNELAKKAPSLPLWLSPTQVRIIPLSRDQLEYCKKLSEKFEGIRADVDDYDDTLGKKIRNAELDWVPYVAVVGKKEIDSGKLTVRIRESGEQKQMDIDSLLKEIKSKTRGYPYRELSLPRLLSKRPIFSG
jgi:threonyl-tRNA synthetase